MCVCGGEIKDLEGLGRVAGRFTNTENGRSPLLSLPMCVGSGDFPITTINLFTPYHTHTLPLGWLGQLPVSSVIRPIGTFTLH